MGKVCEWLSFPVPISRSAPTPTGWENESWNWRIDVASSNDFFDRICRLTVKTRAQTAWRDLAHNSPAIFNEKKRVHQGYACSEHRWQCVSGRVLPQLGVHAGGATRKPRAFTSLQYKKLEELIKVGREMQRTKKVNCELWTMGRDRIVVAKVCKHALG